MIFKQVYDTVCKYSLIEAGDGIVVGVSGGADSVCLLLSLVSLKKEIKKYNDIKICAVHVHHGIRGKEADRDATFTENLAKKLGVPVRIVRIDVPALSKASGFSEEETGRRERYRIFEEVREELGFNKIAVAHNRDDLCETFLLNLARGTGLAGLSGIKAVNGRIIRPLIETGRKDIEFMTALAGASFITDSTNLSDDYTRNRIRHVILPAFKEGINEKVDIHIAMAAEKINDAFCYIEKEGKRAAKELARKESGGFSIDNEAVKLDHIILTEMIHKILADVAGRQRDISTVHINAVADLFFEETGSHLDLIYGMKAEKTYSGVRIFTDKSVQEKIYFNLYDINFEIIDVPEVAKVKRTEKGLLFVYKDGNKEEFAENNCTKFFDYDKICTGVCSSCLKVRTREPGDYIIIDTKGHSRKLKEYFIDAKVPSAVRDDIVLLAAEKNVLWIPGMRSGEGARVGAGTTRLVKAVAIKKTGEENGR